MKLRWCLPSLVVLAVLAGPLAAAGPVTETWRSPWGAPLATSVNPTDNSVWAAIGSSVVHLSADSAVLSRSDNFWGPACVAVNAADGSCWVAESYRNQVVHLSAAGDELWRGGDFVLPLFVSVNPGDGSVWVATGGQNFATPEVTGEPEVVHLAADGTVLWRTNAYRPSALAVSPADGACWVNDYNTSRLVRLSSSGEETAAVSGLTVAGQIGTGLADGSVWVGDVFSGQVVHLSASGDELARAGALLGPSHVVVNPADGSLWVLVLAPVVTEPPPTPTEAVHLSASGEELSRAYGFRESSATTTPLAVNPTDGSLWVADAAQAALVHLAADGNRLVRLQNFDDPWSLAVNSTDHTVWVADTGLNRIVQLDQDGNQVRVINNRTPLILAVNPTDGSLWEIDYYLTRVTRFSGDGTELWHKDFPHLGVALALNPNDGSAWVSTYDAVIHLSSDGAELWRGTGYSAYGPLALDPTDGSCWTAIYELNDSYEITHYKLAHLAADGHEIWRSPEWVLGVLSSMAVDPRDGSVRIADYSLGAVTSVSRQGETLWTTHVGYVPGSPAVDPSDGACWVVVYGSSSVVLLGPDGTILWHGTGFSYPRSVSVDTSNGAGWVADTGDAQVVRLDSSRFIDVPADSWAAEAIYECAGAGIVTGYWDGRYEPSQPVTRAQMAVYLARALAGSDAAVPDGPARSAFPDVGTDEWAYRHIAYCAAAGVADGYPGGAYRPDEVVSRAQMAVYISRAIADPVGEAGLAGYEGPSSATFSDVPPDQWAYRYIEYAAAHGIVQGFAGRYAPDAPVTRDQMAVFVARAFLW